MSYEKTQKIKSLEHSPASVKDTIAKYIEIFKEDGTILPKYMEGLSKFIDKNLTLAEESNSADAKENLAGLKNLDYLLKLYTKSEEDEVNISDEDTIKEAVKEDEKEEIEEEVEEEIKISTEEEIEMTHEEKIEEIDIPVEKQKEEEEVLTEDTLKEDTVESIDPKEIVESKPENLILDTGEVFGEMDNDVKFNEWLENMSFFLKNDGINFSTEAKSIKDWYKEYQETLPYIKKLETILEEIENSTNDDVELLAAKSKIHLLIYKVHTTGETQKQEIDIIFNSHNESKLHNEKIESLKKTKELKEVIEKSKNKGGVSSRGITSDQVKQVLESRGEENTAENLNELINFLEDFQENYDFYYSGIKKEDQENSTRRAYERYKALGKVNTQPVKAKGFSKFLSSIIASFPKNVDNQDNFNHFIRMTVSIRGLDLVDRKNNNEEKVQNNKQKMSDLIHFCKNNSDTLDKYLTNKDSVDVSSLESDNEGKELLKNAAKLFTIFTEGKYKTPSAGKKAEKILAETSDFDESIISTPTIEVLYSVTPEDKNLFETKAKLSINKKVLTETNLNIEELTKSTTKIEKPELEKIEKNIDSMRKTILDLGSDKDKNNLKIVELKFSVLILKNTNTENLQELSDSFKTYEYILSSTEIKKEEKEDYIKTLIANLEKHLTNEKSTMIQKIRLNAIIEKYNKVLKSIK